LSEGFERIVASPLYLCLPETTPSESEDEINLGSGDRLVLYTDGLIEVFNKRGEMLGVEGFEELVRQSAKEHLRK
jgi:serine phosphatase RsbU (regulator of sigma subunit)